MTSHKAADTAREVAVILNRAMTDAGMTQTQLAAKSGISQSQISKLLRGDRQMRLDWLYALAESLGLNVVSVVHEAEQVVVARRRAQATERDAAAEYDALEAGRGARIAAERADETAHSTRRRRADGKSEGGKTADVPTYS